MRRTQFVRWIIFSAFALILSGAAMGGESVADRGLRVFFIDVEGGQATLFIAAGGESLLIDTGWPGYEGRDAERIVEVAQRVGLRQIDYVLITHYHDDHVGGAPELARRFPIGTFIDHGVNRETSGSTEANWKAYKGLLNSGRYRHIVAKAGEQLPIKGMSVQVISSDGAVIDKPLPGAGEINALCRTTEKKAADATENARSLGVLVSYGKLKVLDLGDLTWDKEVELMCPVNKVGKVEVLIVSHHGWSESSSPALVDAVGARVAIMDNGAKKGGSPQVVDTIRKAPGLEGLWQLHFSEEGGAEHNTPGKYIANPAGEDLGKWIELAATSDGGFRVTNSRTGYTQTYAAKQ